MEAIFSSSLKKNSREEYKDYLKKLVLHDSEGMLEERWEGLNYFISSHMANVTDYGLTDKFLRMYPLREVVEQAENLDEALYIVRNTIMSTAHGLEEEKKNTLGKFCVLKLTTLRSLYTQKTLAKPSKSLRCGSIEEDYARLANRSDEIDIMAYVTHLSEEDMMELGVELIRNGQLYRKTNKGKWLELVTKSGSKTNVYFATENDEQASSFLTQGRCAIATAIPTSKFLASQEDMPALGLNLGWHGLATEEEFRNINTLFQSLKLSTIDISQIYLVTIPKVKPHPSLKMSHSLGYLFLSFHCLNDAYNSSKRKDGRIEVNFTADAYSKLTNMGVVFDPPTFRSIISYIIRPCMRNMKHKGAVSRDLVNMIKSVVKTMETWKLQADKTKLMLEDTSVTDDDMKNLVFGDVKQRAAE